MALFGEATQIAVGGTTIAGVFDINGPDSSVTPVEKTPLGASQKQFRPSQITEAGTVSFSYYYDPSDATHVLVRGYANAPAATDPEWTITYSDGTTHVFDGFITQASMTGSELESEVACECEVQITGGVVETVAV